MATAPPDSGTPGVSRRRSFWLPLAAFAAVAAVSFGGWFVIDRQERQLAAAVLQERVDAVEATLRQGVLLRAESVSRMAQRLALAGSDAERARLFSVETDIYLRQYDSMLAFAWVDAAGAVRLVAARPDVVVPPTGTRLDVDAARLAAGQAEPRMADSWLLAGRAGVAGNSATPCQR